MKILISSGYGAGWSTWNSGEVGKFMLTYQPIIDFIEAGNSFTNEDCRSRFISRNQYDDSNIHPLLKQLKKDVEEKFGQDYLCILGAHDLEVTNVNGSFKVTEYDGFEGLEFRDQEDWIDAND